ncbi:MAG TPA: AAC(3) family N-acetyltransferase [Pseudomonadales bacterium]|nr:AAC(3) family N-acetyltransferase [Pseudomonadales bacterium]
MITRQAVAKFVEDHHLADAVICLHSSFKSFGKVEGGPQTIVDGFLQSGCTLLVPTFFYHSGTFPVGHSYEQNGIDYEKVVTMPAQSFEDRPDQIDRSMGVIPRTILERQPALREKNPHDSFGAIGPLAEFLLHDHDVLSVYSAYKNIYRNNLPAFVVLAGVGLTSCTPVHFAEEVAGRCLFRRWAVYRGETVEVEVGSCSDGFDHLNAAVTDVETLDYLGESPVRIYAFNAFVDAVASAIRTDPSITQCSVPGCERCRDMTAGGRRAQTRGWHDARG